MGPVPPSVNGPIDRGTAMMMTGISATVSVLFILLSVSVHADTISEGHRMTPTATMADRTDQLTDLGAVVDLPGVLEHFENEELQCLTAAVPDCWFTVEWDSLASIRGYLPMDGRTSVFDGTFQTDR